MKLCYIAPYRDGTGYSHSAISHILALDSVGVDVVARPVRMTGTQGEVPDKIKDLEAKDLNGVDVVLQHNLPSEFSYKGGVKNVGLFAYETTNFHHSGWRSHLEMMDKVLVSCKQQYSAVLNTCGDSVAKKTAIIQHPVDVSKFDQYFDVLDFGVPKNAVKFYTISECTRRKNIAALLAAYYTAFSRDDNVLLILKTHVPNRDTDSTADFVQELANGIKKTLNRFENLECYPPLALLPTYLSNSEINSLHKTGNVFVSASHAEAICLPFLDAMGFGNPTIVPNYSAFMDYQFDRDLLVDTPESVVIGVNDSIKGLYTSDERWGNISIPDLIQKMRMIYDNPGEFCNNKLAKERNEFIRNNLSYEKVGSILKDRLSNAK